jgi:hypothetical protein
MKLHLLLTSEIAQTKPNTCKVLWNFGYEQVIFSDVFIKVGINCIVEDTEENIIFWLKPFGEFVKGIGSPRLEQFRLENI